MNGLGAFTCSVARPFITFLNNRINTHKQEPIVPLASNRRKMSIKIVELDEVRELMDHMMNVPILPASEKRRMLVCNIKPLLDPNLIMDARHKILCETLPSAPVKCSVLSEAKRREAIGELNWEKEQAFLERELKKFEKELQRMRPKFGAAYSCSRKNFAASDDDEFWRTSSHVRVKTYGVRKSILMNDNTPNEKTNDTIPEDNRKFVEQWSAPLDTMKENEKPYIGDIKVTIKDKLSQDTEEQRLEILRKIFEALMQNAKEERRLRGVKSKVQILLASRRLRKCFEKWRTFVERARKKKMEDKAKDPIQTDAKKIEMLVGVISEKQKELFKVHMSDKEAKFEAGTSTDVQVKSRRKVYGKHVVFDSSSSQCRLTAQKAIIEKQKTRLAEQEKLIEELKLKQVQEEIARANSDTVIIAKETLINCGQQTRRTFIQLMRQAGYRGKSLKSTQQVTEPPKFLARMEARAVARRERVKMAQVARQKKLEERKRQKEAMRQEEEQERRRAQQEALRKIRKLREQQEQYRAGEIERFRKLNEMADNFYRKYLLRRYILDPFYSLIETRNCNIKTANNHCRMSLMRKIFTAWSDETEWRRQIKIELVTSTYERNLMWYAFRDWRNVTKQGRQKYQVAKDLYDLRLLDKSFKIWGTVCSQLKAKQLENERSAKEHYEINLQAKYMKIWKKYSEIADEIKESERRKNEWREIVQQVIPDFDPKHRGVALED